MLQNKLYKLQLCPSDRLKNIGKPLSISVRGLHGTGRAPYPAQQMRGDFSNGPAGKREMSFKTP